MDETGQAAVDAALEMLAGLADAGDLAQVKALRERLGANRLRVLVVGEAKRGKSTLVNALLKRDLLPSGVTPLTAIATTVLPAQADEGIDVTFADGGTERHPLAALTEFGTERGNPGNSRRVAAITAWVRAPGLLRGAEIVDTPGTGSVHAHNSAAADAALPTMDAAVFVLTADPPVSATERELLTRVAGLSVRLFIVLNKADYLTETDLAEAVEFTASVAAAATGRPQRVYPVSARAALRPGGDAGFAAFAADLAAYLDSGGDSDLETSVARQARRIAEAMLDEVTLARRVARLPEAGAAQRVAAFAARLEAVQRQRGDAEDRAAGQCRRLLASLNTAAEAVRPQIEAAVARQFGRLLDGTLGAATPAEIQQAGRSMLTDMVVAAVEDWRHGQAAELDAGLSALDDRLAADLEAELTAVRAAAAELLGVQLAIPAPGGRLAPDAGFFYVTGENVDQSELLAGVVRRRLPGELGRRVARAHLFDQVPDLVDACIGRARGSLQYQLGEVARRLQAEIGRRYAVSTDRLTAALDRAAEIRSAATDAGASQLTALAERGRALTAMIARLQQPAGDTLRGPDEAPTGQAAQNRRHG